MQGEILSIELLIAAFAGGVFGAAIGALPAFVLTGVLVIIGEILATIERAGNVILYGPGFTETVAFGAVFGPHVSFAGGAAAAAFAARRGYLSWTDSAYPAKEITVGLGAKIDVLAVGGIFGMLGHLLFVGSTVFAGPWDPVAAAIVVSAIMHRAILGYDLVGSFDWDDLRPRRPAIPDGGTGPDPWLPHMSNWSEVAILGAFVGVIGGSLAYLTASPFLAFGLSAVSLVFLLAGVDKIPVTHHMTLPASTAALALTGLPLYGLSPDLMIAEVAFVHALAIGGLFGLVGGLAGEFAQRIFYGRAQTHFDPPAASIVITTSLIAGLAMCGILPTAVWIPHP